MFRDGPIEVLKTIFANETLMKEIKRDKFDFVLGEAHPVEGIMA